MIFPVIRKFGVDLVKRLVAMQGTMSNLSFLSTPGQVTSRLNVQYSQMSNSSDSLCLS